jgi:hypothetical protein
MLTNVKKCWLKPLGLAAVAALAVGAAGLSPAPAEARVIVATPVAVPYYVPPPPVYYYPYRVAYRHCAPGWHFVPGHWNRWGAWVPPGCRPNW